VKDFITQPHIASQMSDAVGESFDPYRRLEKAYLRHVKDPDMRTLSAFEACLQVSLTLIHTSEPEIYTNSIQSDLFDALDDTLQYFGPGLWHDAKGLHPLIGHDLLSFLRLLVIHNIPAMSVRGLIG
jgi:hypothetical protein